MNSEGSAIKPLKGLGQHFLRDKMVCERISAFIPAGENDALVEIGPGEGALTAWLAGRFKNITAIEIDARAAALIRSRYPQITLLEADFLAVDVMRWAETPVHLCGNLPYYITSPILFQFLDHMQAFLSGTFMMQKEVADRLKAVPRTKEYGILSVQTQLKCSVKTLFDVPPEAFYPPPKVWSSVVQLIPDRPPSGIPDAWLKKTVRTAFNQRRKTLRNSLKSGFPPEAVEKAEVFQLHRRAEELVPQEFVELAKILHA